MTVIKQQDLIDSVADALQFISYYHPLDFVQAVHRAWVMEQNSAAKGAMAQILINSGVQAIAQSVRTPVSSRFYRDRYGRPVGGNALSR